MILEKRDWFLWTISRLIWQIPGRGATKLAEFSHTEAGSGLDMLAAVEETPRPDMRVRYFRHALDELKHAGMFRNRALAMAEGPSNRTKAVLDDAAYIKEHGINETKSLFSQLGELEFLAFVWIAECRGAQQFDVYSELMRDNDASQTMFEEIAHDERFHIAYSRAELDRYKEQGKGAEVKKAIFRVRRRRYLQAWLRFSHVLGDAVSKLWLGLIYFSVLGPSSVMAKLSEKNTIGFSPPLKNAGTTLERALQQG